MLTLVGEMRRYRNDDDDDYNIGVDLKQNVRRVRQQGGIYPDGVSSDRADEPFNPWKEMVSRSHIRTNEKNI